MKKVEIRRDVNVTQMVGMILHHGEIIKVQKNEKEGANLRENRNMSPTLEYHFSPNKGAEIDR